MYEYLLLFSSAFVSSTLFPGGSEALFIYYLKQDPSLKWYFFIVVTVGNSLGSITTYFLGYYVNFGQQKASIKYPKTFYFCKKWGAISLLLSWLPIIGDVMCLFAGWLKLNKSTCFINIIIGKGLRYLILIFFMLIWS